MLDALIVIPSCRAHAARDIFCTKIMRGLYRGRGRGGEGEEGGRGRKEAEGGRGQRGEGGRGRKEAEGGRRQKEEGDTHAVYTTIPGNLDQSVCFIWLISPVYHNALELKFVVNIKLW